MNADTAVTKTPSGKNISSEIAFPAFGSLRSTNWKNRAKRSLTSSDTGVDGHDVDAKLEDMMGNGLEDCRVRGASRLAFVVVEQDVDYFLRNL